MSLFIKPLDSRVLWSTGDVLLRANVDLSIRLRRSGWKDMPFIVDSGSEITTMSAFDAQMLGIPIPQRPASGAIHQPTGLEIRSGVLRCRVVGMDQSEYAIPCFFLGDPTRPVHASAVAPRNLLGLSGVVDRLRITLDGRPSAGAVYGYLIIEKQ